MEWVHHDRSMMVVVSERKMGRVLCLSVMLPLFPRVRRAPAAGAG